MLARLARTVPLLQQVQGYDRAAWRSDLTAGLTTAVMLIPQGMAYAMLAGLEPIVGLYAATLPLVVYALLGTSRQLAVGPVALDSLLVASAVGVLAGGDAIRYAALAGLLALMVGALQWGMGAARVGFLVKFLSQPVISGFTSAAALIIGVSQLGTVMGVSLPRSAYVHETLVHALGAAGDAHGLTVAVSVASVALLVGLKRYAPRVPRFLLVVVLGSLAVWAFGLDARGVAIVGDVPSGLPRFTLPGVTAGDAWSLIPAAVTIALVGFMESITVAKRFGTLHRHPVDPDRELKAVGLANVVGGLFQAYPVAGGLSRTAVNDQAGARTQVATLVTAGAVALTLALLTPLFTWLPNAVLGAIILTAVLGLVDVAEVRALWRVSRPDLGVLALTFLATLFVGVQQGIAIGVFASLAWFVWRTSKPHVAVLGRLPGTTTYRNVKRHPHAQVTPGVVAIRVDAPLYFANTAFLEQTLRDAMGEGPIAHLVVDCTPIGSVDAQALTAIGEIVDDLQRQGVTLWLTGVRGPVRDAFVAARLLERIGPDHLLEHVHDAMCRIAPPLAVVSAGARG